MHSPQTPIHGFVHPVTSFKTKKEPEQRLSLTASRALYSFGVVACSYGQYAWLANIYDKLKEGDPEAISPLFISYEKLNEKSPFLFDFLLANNVITQTFFGITVSIGVLSAFNKQFKNINYAYIGKNYGQLMLQLIFLAIQFYFAYCAATQFTCDSNNENVYDELQYYYGLVTLILTQYSTVVFTCIDVFRPVYDGFSQTKSFLYDYKDNEALSNLIKDYSKNTKHEKISEKEWFSNVLFIFNKNRAIKNEGSQSAYYLDEKSKYMVATIFSTLVLSELTGTLPFGFNDLATAFKAKGYSKVQALSASGALFILAPFMITIMWKQRIKIFNAFNYYICWLKDIIYRTDSSKEYDLNEFVALWLSLIEQRKSACVKYVGNYFTLAAFSFSGMTVQVAFLQMAEKLEFKVPFALNFLIAAVGGIGNSIALKESYFEVMVRTVFAADDNLRKAEDLMSALRLLERTLTEFVTEYDNKKESARKLVLNRLQAQQVMAPVGVILGESSTKHNFLEATIEKITQNEDYNASVGNYQSQIIDDITHINNLFLYMANPSEELNPGEIINSLSYDYLAPLAELIKELKKDEELIDQNSRPNNVLTLINERINKGEENNKDYLVVTHKKPKDGSKSILGCCLRLFSNQPPQSGQSGQSEQLQESLLNTSRLPV